MSKVYYQGLYWANKRNIAWEALKRNRKNKKLLKEFVKAYLQAPSLSH